MNHRYLPFEELVLEQLYYQTRLLRHIVSQQEKIVNELRDLKAAVAAEKTVVNSAIILLNGLKEKLDEAIASEDPAALQALSDELGSQTHDLAAAVQNNTPVPVPDITITSASPLARAVVGVPYTQEFDATGGVKPYAWSSADLPGGGVVLDASTGFLTFTPPPEAAGQTVNFDVVCTDKAGTSVSKAFELSVDAAPFASA